MKKLLSLFLILSISVLSLTACGQSKPADSGKAPEKLSNAVDIDEQNTASSPKLPDYSAGSSSSDTKKNEQPETPKQRVKVVELIPEVATKVYIYSDGMGSFYYKGKWGYLDRDGKVVIEPKYATGAPFNEGYTPALTGDGKLFVILDKKGNEVFKSNKYGIDKSSKFNENAAVVTDRSKLGSGYFVIDTSGKELYNMTGFHPKGIMTCGVIVWAQEIINKGVEIMATDKSGNQVVPPMMTGFNTLASLPTLNFTDDLLAVPNADKTWNVIDKSGRKILQKDYENLKQPSEGMIPFMQYGKWGYLDYQGNVVIEPQYADADSFSNGLAAVKADTQRGFIDNKNNMVIQPQFGAELRLITTDYYKFDANGFAVVPDNNGAVIDRNGEIVVSSREPCNIYYGGDGIVCFYTGAPSSKLYKFYWETDDSKQSQTSSRVSGSKEYIQKLDAVESGLKELDSLYPGSSMQNQIVRAEETYKRWDNALNEIYQSLSNQLPADEMSQLKEKQSQWKNNRETTARDASSKYQGGVLESLEYAKKLAQVTKERCYELVDTYME